MTLQNVKNIKRQQSTDEHNDHAQMVWNGLSPFFLKVHFKTLHFLWVAQLSLCNTFPEFC